MSESKIPRPPKEMLDAITKEFVDKGMLIEAGWKAYELISCPADIPPWQREEMRVCFFAGAQHLWASIINFLEEGKEPTLADERRMTLIHDELQRFYDYCMKRAKEHGHL